MRKLIGFLITIIPLLSFTQTISITGNAVFFKNEPIKVYSFTNAITNEKQLIQETQISEDGSYELALDLAHPQEIIVKIEMREMYLKVHPGAKIRLNFLPIVNASNQRNPIRYALKYNFLPEGIAPDSVYHIIESDFANIQENIDKSTSKLQIYNQFFIEHDSIYTEFIQHDTLFNVFYTYFKAKSYLQTNTSKKTLIKKYILNQPIHYENHQYLKFFKFVISSELNHTFSKNANELESAKKEYKIYDALMAFLSSNPLLKDEEIRSLSLLLYTKSKSSQTYFDNQIRTAIINQLGNFCPFPAQSEAALYYQQNHQTFAKNQEAPLFELPNKNGDYVTLNSLRGKPVYLGFIHSKSATCQKDLQVIVKLKKKYRRATFVLVVSDRDSVIISQLPKEASNLKYLYLNKDYSVLEQYQIWNYPVYFLLDKHGYFIESPAKSPMEMFDTFDRMFAPKSRKKSYEIIKD